MSHDPFHARHTLTTPLGERVVFRLDTLRDIGDVDALPYSIKVLLESVLRNHDGRVFTDDDVRAVAQYDATKVGEAEVAYKPARVVLQDFTGVPAVVDLAAMRAAIVRMTGDPASAARVNPQVQSDLVIDHSVQVDAFNSDLALLINSEKEFERNRERYEFLQVGSVRHSTTSGSCLPPSASSTRSTWSISPRSSGTRTACSIRTRWSEPTATPR